ncbi:MAG: carboxypeptidase-like regulatory domain-containing protein [Saprospiraceae bacterium]
MKNSLLLFAAILFSCSVAQAQTIVRGKIIDETGFEVIGANVYFSSDVSAGTSTDIDGTFELNTERSGTDTIVISYISYNTERLPVALDGTTQALGEILLAEQGVALADVVVVARMTRNNDRAMQTIERKSLNTVNAISSQAFAQRGDSDAASAVGRVTGVSVEGGKYVYVRGLSDRYSKSTLNGASIPGLDPNKNAVQMDLFPTNLIDNIVVYKNFTPDLPGDFTGGLVDITTKDFPDELTVRASASVGANTNAHFGDAYLSHQTPSGAALAMGGNDRAIPIDLATLPSQTDILVDQNRISELSAATLALNNNLVPESTTATPNHNVAFSIGNQKKVGGKPLGFIGGFTYNRNASGYSGGTQGRYKLTQTDAATLNTLRTVDDASFTDEVTIGALASASMKLNKLNKIGINLMHNRNGQQVTRLQTNGRIPDASGAYYEARTLGYTERALSTVQLQGEHATGTENSDWKIDYILAATLSQMDQPDLRFINNFYDIDADGNKVDQFIEAAEDILPTRFSRDMTETNLDGHFNMSRGFTQWNDLESRLKFGAGYLLKDRTFRETTLRYQNENDGNVEDFSDFANASNVVGGESGTDPNQGVYIADFTQEGNQYDSQMGIGHAYVMTELPINNRLKSVVGVRAETTTLDFTSLREQNNLNNTRLIEGIDVLPSASMVYTTEDEYTNIRFGYSRTLARPTFREVAPVSIYDEVLNAFVLGDTELQRTQIDNIDLRFEKYAKSGDMFSVGGFYKRFTNPIELTINPEAINLELQYRNVPNADLYGAEVEFNKQLTSLLPGLSAGANVTYVLSQVDIPDTELETIRDLNPEADDTRPMFGQSPYIVNAFLNFRNDKGLTGNLTYNVQGQRLSLVSRGGTPNVFEQAFNSLNAKMSVPVGKQLKLSARVANILDSERRFTQEYKGADYVFQSFRPGRTFSVGASWSL